MGIDFRYRHRITRASCVCFPKTWVGAQHAATPVYLKCVLRPALLVDKTSQFALSSAGLLERAECVCGPEYFRLQLRRVHAVPRRRADAQLHLRPRAVQLKRGGGRADEVVGALHRDARDVPDALDAFEQRRVLEEAVVHLGAYE